MNEVSQSKTEEPKSAFSVLLYGPAGVGKTVSLYSLLKAGQKVRFLGLEANAFNGMKYAKELFLAGGGKLNPGDLSIARPSKPKRGLAEFASAVEGATKKALKVQRSEVDLKKKDYDGFSNTVAITANFTDEETGESLGSAEDWGKDTTLVIDGLTALSELIIQHNIGGKIAIDQGEWGISQGYLKNFLRLLTDQLQCNLVLIAHPKKEVDEVGGGKKIYPASLGNAMDNWLPTIFTDVIYASRKEGKYTWSTDHRQAVTRATYLPVKESMPANFKEFFTTKGKKIL